jgi:Family of unknown function (DUF6152)
MDTTRSPWFLAITLALLTLSRAQTLVSQSTTPQLYEPGKRVTVTGMLMGSAAPSPPQSVYLLVTARDAKGNEQHWAIEGDPIDELKKRGWRDDALTMGEEITVTGHPPRAGQRPQDRMSTPGRGRGRCIWRSLSQTRAASFLVRRLPAQMARRSRLGA